jgi:hypothetical protein
MATKPFQTSVEILLPSGTEGQNGSFTVPHAKRLVIEYASGQAFLPTGQKALLSVITSLQGQSTGTTHYLQTTTAGSFGSQDYFSAGETVRLYADAGTIVMLRADRNSPTGAATARLSISGELVDV